MNQIDLDSYKIGTNGDITIYPGRRKKIINDPIHGFISLEPLTIRFVDTKPVQRLRQLSQLGFTYYVYPGASHKRFEHSLGVAHLSKKYTDSLLEKDVNAESLTKKQKTYFSNLVEIAGLCHDLGHGPYSHSFENYVIKSAGITDWKHENMSLSLVDYIYDNYDLNDDDGDGDDVIGKNEIDLIKRLIHGGPILKNEPTEIPAYMFDIVNNKRNSFDVDKLDYLQRDSMYSNVKVSASYDRFLNFMEVIDGRINYRWKERGEIFKVFQDRYNMFKTVYYHRVTHAVELMMTDAIKELSSILNINEAIYNPKDFLALDDSIFSLIANEWVGKGTAEGKRALQLTERIIRRDLYCFCDEVKVPSSIEDKINDLETLKMEITTRQSTNGQVDLRPSDIDVVKLSMEYPTEKNTFKKNSLYVDRGNEPFCLLEDMLEHKKDILLRVYCKNKNHRQNVVKAFDNWISEFSRDSNDSSTNGCCWSN